MNYLFDRDEVEKIFKVANDGLLKDFGGLPSTLSLVEPVKRRMKELLDPFASLHGKEVRLEDIHIWFGMGSNNWFVRLEGPTAEIFKVEKAPESETSDTTV